MTIYDIAEAAGVSPSTVSRVINNKKGVRRETKERVLKYLELFHYSPNETARSLVNQASKIIGILVADLRTTHHTDGVYYMEREFVKLGYCCIIMNTGTEEEDKARYIQILRQRRVEAAVLIGSTFQSEPVQQAIEKYLPTTPVIIANGYLDLPNVYGVIADEQAGVTNCVKLLADRDRRNLAFIIDNLTPSNRLKQLGFEIGVRQWYDQTEPLVVRCAPSLQGAYDATCQLVEEHPEVDGIVYAVDMLAVGGIRSLRDKNIEVPGQIAVIGVDNSIYGQICFPSLTSLDNKLFDLSVTAARNLMDVLQNKPVTKNMMVLSSIVEREST
jgi:LacI family transcriptional regulator